MLRLAVRRLARQPGRKAPAAAASAGKAQPPAPQADDWEEVTDPKTSQSYWWNKKTGETTVLGAPKPGPDPWQEVKDPNSGQSYWWNKQTNATTAVGAPKPSALAAAPGQAQPPAAGGFGGGGLMGALADGLAWGVGTSVASRMMDSVLGPRQMEMHHTYEGDQGAAAGGGGADAAPPPPGQMGDMGDLQSQGWSWGDPDSSNSGGNEEGGGGFFGGFFDGDDE
mmetsp:Transcript_62212/g.148428  ORF Transcript_62212/g.148428 Transcript_62212/m.148428 type:complete len:224 (-) Transcript_62212:335-1006(-)